MSNPIRRGDGEVASAATNIVLVDPPVTCRGGGSSTSSCVPSKTSDGCPASPKLAASAMPCGAASQACGFGPHAAGARAAWGSNFVLCRRMTIAKARQSDKAHCRRVNKWKLARWRAKHRDRYNAYMRQYMRTYRRRQLTIKNGGVRDSELTAAVVTPSAGKEKERPRTS